MLLKRRLFGLLFPRDLTCGLCGAELAREETACCESCQAQLNWICIRREVEGLDGVYAAAEYAGAVRELILRFKYKNNRHLAHLFALQMADFPGPDMPLLLPVPMHPIRRRERGFCQTTELCEELAVVGGYRIAPKAIRRVRNTASQTQLDGSARLANMRDAFAADGKVVEGKNCVLVDDVVSTGATLSACAAALRKAGASTVNGWSIAT